MNKKLEQKALKVSTISYLLMALLGIGFAISSKSQAVLVDGAYSFVSFIMVILSRYVVSLVEQPDSESFHFGYAQFEPLINTIRGLLILLILGYSFVTAVMALKGGVHQVKTGMAAIYGLLVAILCISLAFSQRYFAKKAHSPILETDARTWFIDGIISFGIFIAFVGVWLLQKTSYQPYVHYADPNIVMLLGLFMINIPIATIKQNIKQMLFAAPDKAMQQAINLQVDEVLRDYAIAQHVVRMVQIGRFFYVMMNIIVAPEFTQQSITEQDQIRAQMAERLKGMHPRIILDVVFSGDKKWLSATL